MLVSIVRILSPPLRNQFRKVFASGAPGMPRNTSSATMSVITIGQLKRSRRSSRLFLPNDIGGPLSGIASSRATASRLHHPQDRHRRLKLRLDLRPGRLRRHDAAIRQGVQQFRVGSHLQAPHRFFPGRLSRHEAVDNLSRRQQGRHLQLRFGRYSRFRIAKEEKKRLPAGDGGASEPGSRRSDARAEAGGLTRDKAVRARSLGLDDAARPRQCVPEHQNN